MEPLTQQQYLIKKKKKKKKTERDVQLYSHESNRDL